MEAPPPPHPPPPKRLSLAHTSYLRRASRLGDLAKEIDSFLETKTDAFGEAEREALPAAEVRPAGRPPHVAPHAAQPTRRALTRALLHTTTHSRKSLAPQLLNASCCHIVASAST